MADAANPFVVGPAEVAIPARKNPVIYVRLFVGLILVGASLRRGGIFWLLGIAGGLLAWAAGAALYSNRPTTTLGQ